MIPESKVEAVQRALQLAFHTTSIDEIKLLTGGLSTALVFRIVVAGKPYLLRIVMRINEFNDPVRQYACMNIAARAGIAPHVWYSSAEDALSITDFIQVTPGPVPATDDLLVRLADRVRAIHTTPPFPKPISYLDTIDGMIRHFKASAMLPESATEEHFRYYSQLQRTYPRYDPDLVSSHNDLNRGNLLFEGARIWIVDWEAACLNDRYVDLAHIANGFISSVEQEAVFLTAYFGGVPDEYQRARFFLMRQVAHMFYAMVFMSLAGARRDKHDANMETPALREFYYWIATGKVLLDSYEGQLLFGKTALNHALRNMKTPRYAQACEIVGSGGLTDGNEAVQDRPKIVLSDTG
jgi:aminoglycoside phosphotransferase (APT) family kinase protein